MTDTTQNQKPPPAAKRAPIERDPKKTVRVDLVSRLMGPRIIDDGTEAHKMIVVLPGETKTNVEMAEWRVAKLRAANRKKRNTDVEVYPAGKAPAPRKESEADDGDEDADDAE